MSKKHFIALADAIKAYNKNVFEEGRPPFGKLHLELLADFCASTNPRFKRERWLDYIECKCGPNGGAR